MGSQCCVARVQPSSGGAFPCCAGQHQLCGSQKPVVDQPCALLLLRLRMSPWFPVLSASADVQNTRIVHVSCEHEGVSCSLAAMLAKWLAKAKGHECEPLYLGDK